MKEWHYAYRLTDGVFTGQRVRARISTQLRAPDGCGYIAGEFDRRTQRVDVTTGQVVPYVRSPQEVTLEQRGENRRRARAAIRRLERAQQRPLRELYLDPANEQAKARLQAIDSEIATLRGQIT